MTDSCKKIKIEIVNVYYIIVLKLLDENKKFNIR